MDAYAEDNLRLFVFCKYKGNIVMLVFHKSFSVSR